MNCEIHSWDGRTFLSTRTNNASIFYIKKMSAHHGFLASRTAFIERSGFQKNPLFVFETGFIQAHSLKFLEKKHTTSYLVGEPHFERKCKKAAARLL